MDYKGSLQKEKHFFSEKFQKPGGRVLETFRALSDNFISGGGGLWPDIAVRGGLTIFGKKCFIIEGFPKQAPTWALLLYTTERYPPLVVFDNRHPSMIIFQEL